LSAWALSALFADMTYEGAHSIIGPYLKDLGATAFQVAMIAGVGEMLGASLRYFRDGLPIARTRIGPSLSAAMR